MNRNLSVRSLIWLTLILLLLVSIVFISYLFFIHKVNDLEQSGQFGDAFGVVTSLFSALAFIAIALALYYQVKEFELQREHLDSQIFSLQRQSFEQSFFQLLGLYNSIVDDIDLSNLPSGGRGRDSFVKIVQALNMIQSFIPSPDWGDRSEKIYEILVSNNDIDDSWDRDLRNLIIEELDKRGRGFDKTYLVYVGHYYNHLYEILKFVDTKSDFLTTQDRNYYINLVTSQLSGYELSVLFYYGLFDHSKDFKSLIEKYAMFKNLDVELTASCNGSQSLNESHFERFVNVLKSFYSESAYS